MSTLAGYSIFSMRPPDHFMKKPPEPPRTKNIFKLLKFKANDLSKKNSTIKQKFTSLRNETCPVMFTLPRRVCFSAFTQKGSRRSFSVSYQRGQQPYDSSYNSRFILQSAYNYKLLKREIDLTQNSSVSTSSEVVGYWHFCHHHQFCKLTNVVPCVFNIITKNIIILGFLQLYIHKVLYFQKLGTRSS